MSKGKWNGGPPPAVGWWPASRNRVYGPYRWWDGKIWSLPAWRGDSLETVAQYAATPSENQKGIWWRYWSKGRAMP
jgi:hypothetical protein